MNIKTFNKLSLKERTRIASGPRSGWPKIRGYSSLCGADLSSANLQGFNLSYADLCHAKLDYTDLKGANLYLAKLDYASLCNSSLEGAQLNLASIQYADLSRASLYRTSMCHAHLNGANLLDAKYALSVVLRAYWQPIPDRLRLELMRHDAIACGERTMSEWARLVDGHTVVACPFERKEREFYFNENRNLWKPGPPKMNYLKLWRALCKASDIKQNR